MNSLSLSLSGSKTAYLPGEKVSGELRWHLEKPPKRLRVALLWYTEGKGDQDVGIAQRLDLPGAEAMGSARFCFALPEKPPSFSGKLISLCWAVEALSKKPGLTRRANIIVGPGGKEIKLPERP